MVIAWESKVWRLFLLQGYLWYYAIPFPWKHIWCVKGPKRVSFVWTAAWGKILTYDNLIKRVWKVEMVIVGEWKVWHLFLLQGYLWYYAISFPRKSIRCVKGPKKVSFVWIEAWGKILIYDNLIKRGFPLVGWCCMCQYSGKQWTVVAPLWCCICLVE